MIPVVVKSDMPNWKTTKHYQKNFSQSDAYIKCASDILILLANLLSYIKNMPQAAIGIFDIIMLTVSICLLID